jgi:hypothetical protein
MCFDGPVVGYYRMDDFTTYTLGSVVKGRLFLRESRRGQPLWVDVWFTWLGHTMVRFAATLI